MLGSMQRTCVPTARCKIALHSSFRPLGLPALPVSRRSRASRQQCRVQAAAQPTAAPIATVGDPEKEESLKYKRVVFDFDKWAKHRATSRYTRHILTMLTSRVVRSLTGPLAAEALLASSVTIYYFAQKAGELPEYAPALPNIALPFSLSSFALSLLLAYRVKESYGRFDEVRKFWGGVVNRSRDFVRQGTTWLNDVEEREAKEMLVRWMIAFPWSFMCHIRSGEDFEKSLKEYLTEEELKYLLSTPHKPNTVLQVLSTITWNTNLPQDKKFRMDENLTLFADMLGASERILRTPLPVSYTRHTSRFLVLWLAFLPFAIIQGAGWATIPASIIIAFLLLATDEVGVQIEEPFSILPLEAISATITTNMKQHLAQDRPDEMLNGGGPVTQAVRDYVAKSMASLTEADVPSKADLIAGMEIDVPVPGGQVSEVVAEIPAALPIAQQAAATPKPNGTVKPVNGKNGAVTPAAPTTAAATVKVPTPSATGKKPLTRFDRKLLEYMQKKVEGDNNDNKA